MLSPRYNTVAVKQNPSLLSGRTAAESYPQKLPKKRGLPLPTGKPGYPAVIQSDKPV